MAWRSASPIRRPMPTTLIDARSAAGEAWARASIEERIGVCLEIVQRLNKQSFLIANAVMHTTGQAFMMAFQAGGPHAQDRALEAVAYAYDEMTRVPRTANWAKPQGKGDPIVLDKSWRIVPRGVSLVIGCATFPTWNGYPGDLRQPRHRQQRDREAASGRDPAARDHREDRRARC